METNDAAPERPAVILHIATPEDWNTAQAAGSYQVASLEEEGFLHFSTEAQVLATAARHYPGVEGLLLLYVDATALGEGLVYEGGEAYGGPFPHLYGPLPVAAVREVRPFPPNPDGSFSLPAPSA